MVPFLQRYLLLSGRKKLLSYSERSMLSLVFAAFHSNWFLLEDEIKKQRRTKQKHDDLEG